MNRPLSRWRFLWEEEMAPPEEVPRAERDEPAGVPRPLRRAARSALIGAAAVTLISQVIEVRLVAPVDAAPSYTSRCIQLRCRGTRGAARTACYRRCVMRVRAGT